MQWWGSNIFFHGSGSAPGSAEKKKSGSGSGGSKIKILIPVQMKLNIRSKYVCEVESYKTNALVSSEKNMFENKWK